MWLKRTAVFLFRLLYRITCTAIILSALIVLAAQTPEVKQWMRTTVLNLVNDALLGKVTCDDITLDIFRGLVLTKPRLYAHGTEVLNAHELVLTYDLAPLSRRIIAINELTLHKPTIRVIRGEKDSVWNVAKIVKPSADTTTTEPTDLTILVRSFKIIGGDIYVNDATFPKNDGSTFDPVHRHLREVNLRANTRLSLKEQDFAVAINLLNFKDAYSSTLSVKELRCVARVSKEGVDVQSLRVLTPTNDIHLRASLKGVNIFSALPENVFQTHPIVADIEGDKVYGPDIRYFVPDIDILESYRVYTNAQFWGNTINFTNIHLTAGQDIVFGKALIENIDGSKPLKIDISVFNSNAQYANIRRRLRFVPMPELTFLNRTIIDTAYIKGFPEDSLWFDVHARDNLGEVKGTIGLKLSLQDLRYSADVLVKNGNLAVLAQDSGLHSDINGKIVASGYGTTLQNVLATATLDLTKSTVAGKRLRSLHAKLHANGQALVTIDSLLADITPWSSVEADSLYEGSLEQTIDAHGTVNFTDELHPAFDIYTTLHRINFARFLSEPTLPELITMNSHIVMQGNNIDEIVGSIEADVKEFALADRAMMPFSMKVDVTRKGTEHSIVLNSSFANVSIVGAYKPSMLIEALDASVQTTTSAIKERVHHVVTSNRTMEITPYTLEPFNATIRAEILDFSPLNTFTQGILISANVTLNAEIKAESSMIAMSVDTLNVRELVIKGDSALRITADPTQGSFKLVVNDLLRKPKVQTFEMNLATDSTIVVNGIVLKNTRAAMLAEANTARFKLASDVNQIRAMVEGNAIFSDEQITLTLDSLQAAVAPFTDLAWRNLRPIHVSISQSVYNIEDFAVQRTKFETISATGFISEDLFTNTYIEVTNFPLPEINAFAQLPSENPVRLLGGLVTSAKVSVNGSWNAPVISADVIAENLSYNGQVIGTLITSLQHKNKNITGTAVIRDSVNATSRKTLDMQINSFPIDCGFVGVEQRLVDNKPIDVDISAVKLELAVAEPFLPAVERVRGVADGTFSVKGVTPHDIELFGALKYKNASFVASATNVTYRSEGAIHLEKSTLYIDTALVYNLVSDKRDGKGLATGKILFDGLTVSSIDFSITTPTSGIQVMKMSSQVSSPDVYGDIIIASGERPIRMHGPLDAPVLEGDIIVKYADLIIPKERSSNKAKYSTVDYNRTSDTVRRFNSITDLIKPQKQQQVIDSAVPKLDIINRTVHSIVKANTPSFTDIITYDLKIYLEGRTVLRMALGLFEVLIADVESADRYKPLIFTGKFGDNTTNLRGKVRVKEGASTYQFYKPFAASGTLDFSNGGISNPTLDLKAVYRDSRTIEGKGREEFRVQMDITGTKLNPHITFKVFRNDREQAGDSTKITGDALMLILVGRTQDELLASGQGNLVSEVNQAFSALATSAIGDILNGIGGINASVDLGADISSSRVTLSGQVFGDVSYRVSGQISDLSGNSTITVSVPFTVLGNAEALRYFTMDVARSLNQTGNVTRQNREWEIKVGARLP